ncbi:MAG TPA: hypothetical protein DCW86_00260 [Actinobacteria bacterium]|nr:hypothetical protein [Actinomycetota bacterium]
MPLLSPSVLFLSGLLVLAVVCVLSYYFGLWFRRCIVSGLPEGRFKSLFSRDGLLFRRYANVGQLFLDILLFWLVMGLVGYSVVVSRGSSPLFLGIWIAFFPMLFLVQYFSTIKGREKKRR